MPEHSSLNHSPLSDATTAIVLAAGKGTRMKSPLPKVLHTVFGKPLVLWAIEAASGAGIKDIVVVVSHENKKAIEGALSHPGSKPAGLRLRFATQEKQHGTGDALRTAVAVLESEGESARHVVVLNGDCPLVRSATVAALLRTHGDKDAAFSLVTSRLEHPEGYGRIIRNREGDVVAIREHKDCSEIERQNREVNPGLYAAELRTLVQGLPKLSADNAQSEYYATDLVELTAREGGVLASIPGDMAELQGVNTPYHLALVEKEMRRRAIEAHAANGVIFADPEQVFVGPDAVIAIGARLGFGVQLRGRCVVGEGAFIDTGCVLEDVEVGKGAHLKPYTVATKSILGEGAKVGPFAHLRPGSHMGPESQIGNFVEMKKTKLGAGSKANHLAYLGDGIIGEGVNLGAGTIFCNYDGFNKHTTQIEDGVFVGSDSQIVAPVRIGKGAYVGTGTTVTKDIPEEALALSRTSQENKLGYAARLKARFKAIKQAKS